MTKAKAYDKLLKLINSQLEKHEILVRIGIIVDASITDIPRKPRGKKGYNITEDRNEDTNESVVKLEEIVKPNVDRAGR